MGMIATVLSTETTEVEEAKVTEVIVNTGGGVNLTGSNFQGNGVDAPPLAGDYAVAVKTQGNGEIVIVGYLDPNDAGVAGQGECRVYSRNADGEVKAEIWLKADGSVMFMNADGQFELKADGQLDVNNGNLTVDP